MDLEKEYEVRLSIHNQKKGGNFSVFSNTSK